MMKVPHKYFNRLKVLLVYLGMLSVSENVALEREKVYADSVIGSVPCTLTFLDL